MSTKSLGRAKYYAYLSAGITTLVAAGTKPNITDKPLIEQLPFKITPPLYAFFLLKADISIPMTQPFLYEERLFYPSSSSTVTIQDADGYHTIDIVQVPEAEPQSLTFADDGAADYCVFVWIGLNRYLIAKCDAILPTVYTRAHGPDTEAGCQAFVANASGCAT